jgi:MFS family permease
LRDAGASGVATFEGQHDVFAPLTLAAAVGGLDLMTNVAIAFPRNPIHLAHQAHDHQLLSGGRFFLGLGTQVRPQIEKRFGAQFDNPVGRMTEMIAALRAIFEAWNSVGRLNFRGGVGLIAVLLSSALGLVSTPGWALLSDRIGRRPPYLFGALAGVVALALFFVAAGSGSAIAVVLAIVFGVNVVHDAMYGPQAAWFPELFNTRVRYSGSSLGYQIGAVSGGFAPLIAAALLVVGGGRPWLIVVYFAVLAAITVSAAYTARETREDRIG